MIPLYILLMLAVIPTAIIDYYAFRGQFAKVYGEPMKWSYFIWPCFLELGMFALGYILGGLE